MGHKTILCVNERSVLLASLCSGGRGSAAGGRGTRLSHPSSEERVKAGPLRRPAAAEVACNRRLGQASAASELVVLGAVNLGLLPNALFCL